MYRSGRATHRLENNLDHQRAARTHGDVLAVLQVEDGDLEAVAAGARVVVELQRGVEGHVFDFDLVVDGVGVGHCCGCLAGRRDGVGCGGEKL